MKTPAYSDHNPEISGGGDVFEGHYVDGERRGPWSAQFANGDAMEKCFENDNEVDC